MQWVIDNPQKARSGLLSMMRPVSVPETVQPVMFGDHLRLVPGAESLVIPAINDIRFIAERSDLFQGWIDSDFKNYGLALKQVPTVATKGQVLEQVKDGKFGNIYTIPNCSLESLCFTQAQVALFVKEHKNWLRTGGYGTFFLFKEKVDGKDKFFVACVYFGDRGQLSVGVYSVSRDFLCYAECLHRFVIPQLAS